MPIPKYSTGLMSLTGIRPPRRGLLLGLMNLLMMCESEIRRCFEQQKSVIARATFLSRGIEQEKAIFVLVEKHQNPIYTGAVFFLA